MCWNKFFPTVAEEIRHNRFNKSSYQYTERRNLTGRGLVNALSISNLHPLDNLNQQHHIYVCTSMKAAPPLSFNTKFLNTWMLPCREINARRIKIYSPSHALNLFKQFFKARAFFYLSFFNPPPPLLNGELYFIMERQLSGEPPFFQPWQTVCQLNSPCHVSPPLPTHARRPSLLLLPLAPCATFVIDHWSNPVPTCSSSAYTSNEVLVV